MQVVCGRDKDEFERRVKWARGMPGMADLPLDKLFKTLQKWFPALIFGSPDEIIEQISAYKDVGVEELMIHWIDINDIEGIQVLVEQVLPRF